MAYVLIQHRVARYSDFEAVFIDDSERRRRLGSTGGKVFRDSEDPENIHILLEWDDVEGAKKFAGGWETREAMEWATAGRAKSQVWVIENILQVEA